MNLKIMKKIIILKEASESAYNKWRDYLDIEYGKGDNIYSKSGMQILKNAEGEEIDKEWKNYCVVDDSSAVPVYLLHKYYGTMHKCY